MKLLFCSLLLSIIISCQQNSTETTEVTENELVGNDLDSHGCKASAGFSWSFVKNECVQVFETGIALAPQDTTLNKALAAYIIFSDDENKETADVELFIPEQKETSLILKPIKDDGAGTWGDKTYQLTQWKGVYTLEKAEKVVYQGAG